MKTFATLFGVLLPVAALAADVDEFKIKRQDVFEFAERPTLTRAGDRTEIRFAAKGWCDVTVAVEDSEGRIVRHLASGVLGERAPAPLQKNSLSQTLVWDGKDDQGRYLDDVERLTVRVSLGLKPQYERSYLSDPKRRIANAVPLLAAGPEGVYVFEGRGVDFVRLYDHNGEYVRTVHPPPADKLDKVLGIERRVFPQDARELPVKQGFVQATLLTSGTSAPFELPYKFGDGYAATAMALHGDRLALAFQFLNRLATDGTTGGLPLTGPKTSFIAKWRGYGSQGGGDEIIGPASIAFSPDGKTLYLAGYLWREFYMGSGHCLHGVLKMSYDGTAEPTVFAGVMKDDDGYGEDNAHFKVPTSVACDAAGRVYVTDFMNDRIQVFDPDGKHLKTIPATRPAKILLHPRTGEMWVFSWPVFGVSNKILKARNDSAEWKKVSPTLTRFGPFDDPKKLSVADLPINSDTTGFFLAGQLADVALDVWADRPTLWVIGRKHNVSRIDAAWGGVGAFAKRETDQWVGEGLRLLVEKDGKWVEARNFARDAQATMLRLKPPDFGRQRLYVNPKTGKLYVVEDLGFGKSAKELLEVDPDTGKLRLVTMPFDAEDICFDMNGLVYLRTDTLVARYDFDTWREVPWDYGEERAQVGFINGGGGRRSAVISGLATPGARPVCWNQGGMAVSPKGHLIVSACSRVQPPKRDADEGSILKRDNIVGRPYTPAIYPGRVRWQEIHVWDKHGRVLYEDAGPGLTIVNGVEMDRDDNIYTMASPNRILDGTPYFNEMAGTMMKFAPRRLKVVGTSRAAAVPLSDESRPKRPADFVNGKVGTAWAEGAEWLYGGVGYTGFNTSRAGGGCHCWNSKFCLDYFARSFAPETDHYSVAVLDSAGNLITRIGRYGNADSAGPDSRVPLGGDEVGLFHAAYVGVHTDHRLFITDTGNGRIAGVRLGYHTTARLPLGGGK